MQMNHVMNSQDEETRRKAVARMCALGNDVFANAPAVIEEIYRHLKTKLDALKKRGYVGEADAG